MAHRSALSDEELEILVPVIAGDDDEDWEDDDWDEDEDWDDDDWDDDDEEDDEDWDDDDDWDDEEWDEWEEDEDVTDRRRGRSDDWN
ncbi:MAG: hypothetical protein GWO00_17810 [Gemmatimonadetes bacterium]|nr:hypothetical protein [Gemmatimonadota bacterium]NIR80146.1 hypothetical protein [Gemmatimonadota bacterium]NIT86111.1 hypothetical protein [Gemmatimonadota bacterium]NIU29928.1 hypothetical protein [Gemmatimonadota bacterium]NIV60337.1 hypothetical protein [Gemmatimonadota bacterium]